MLVRREKDYTRVNKIDFITMSPLLSFSKCLRLTDRGDKDKAQKKASKWEVGSSKDIKFIYR